MNFNPTEKQMEKAKKLAREAAEKASKELRIDTEPEIALGYTHDSFTIETLGGVSGETFNDRKIDIQFNTKPSDWEENLQRTAAHEYAHTHYFSKNPRRRDDPLWKVILGEAQSTNLAEKCFPDAKPPTVEAVNREKLEEYWPEVRERMSEKMGWNNEILFSDFYNHDLPMYYGYSLAFHIGRKLQKKYDLKDFPELEKKDVVEAGDELFR